MISKWVSPCRQFFGANYQGFDRQVCRRDRLHYSIVCNLWITLLLQQSVQMFVAKYQLPCVLKGRVQSVALRLVCDREMEVARFKPQEYWTVSAELSSSCGKFFANLLHVKGKKLQKLSIKNEIEARDIVELAKNSKLTVQKIVVKETRRKPLPPFTTSTLQQEALNKLGFEPSKTDRIAQSLFTGDKIDGTEDTMCHSFQMLFLKLVKGRVTIQQNRATYPQCCFCYAFWCIVQLGLNGDFQ